MSQKVLRKGTLETGGIKGWLTSHSSKLTDDAEDGDRRDEDPLRIEPEPFQFTLDGVVFVGGHGGRPIGDQLLRHVHLAPR